MNDVSKLPKWAQIEISKLRGDLAAAHDKIAQVFNHKNSEVEIEPERASFGLPRLNAPARAIIRFHFGRKHIDFSAEMGGVIVRANEGLLIHSRASNSALIIAQRFIGASHEKSD